ncbi:MAG: hypothetical protein JW715_09820 [Sedimentisphaerales bacterium]|nr:hypothetical protein [Sedimentisphaerales bacterium]
MNLRQIIILLTAAFILIGCSEDSQTTHSQQATLKSGNFSVLDLNGRPLALSLSKSEFQEKFPQLYQDYEKAIANEDITSDASLTTPKTEILK